ncbi:YgiT-type zinc finger protein [Candidatus Poribacteria bacterium]|nr:YgiT-type zinc finger protein [Candidatus Poribacteria bacterium]
MNSDMCEYCDGTVRERVVEREIFKHKNGFVVLEQVPLGVCDKCGRRYYSAMVLHEIDDIATGRRQADYKEIIPIAVHA